MTDIKDESTNVTDIEKMSYDGTINNYNVTLLVDVFQILFMVYDLV